MANPSGYKILVSREIACDKIHFCDSCLDIECKDNLTNGRGGNPKIEEILRRSDKDGLSVVCVRIRY